MCCTEPRDKNTQHAKKPCLKSDCECCKWWLENTGIDKILQESSNSKKKITSNGVSEMLQDVNTLKTQNEELTKDNKKYQKINKELRAKKNGIKAVTASDKPDKTSGENKPRGRPKGQKATKNKRPVDITRTEVVDGTTCPQCKNPLSSTITDEYDRVVQIITTITEYVKFDIKRRWCSKCIIVSLKIR